MQLHILGLIGLALANLLCALAALFGLAHQWIVKNKPVRPNMNRLDGIQCSKNGFAWGVAALPITSRKRMPG